MPGESVGDSDGAVVGRGGRFLCWRPGLAGRPAGGMVVRRVGRFGGSGRRIEDLREIHVRICLNMCLM